MREREREREREKERRCFRPRPSRTTPSTSAICRRSTEKEQPRQQHPKPKPRMQTRIPDPRPRIQTQPPEFKATRSEGYDVCRRGQSRRQPEICTLDHSKPYMLERSNHCPPAGVPGDPLAARAAVREHPDLRAPLVPPPPLYFLGGRGLLYTLGVRVIQKKKKTQLFARLWYPLSRCGVNSEHAS